jgi:hypothetical protein
MAHGELLTAGAIVMVRRAIIGMPRPGEPGDDDLAGEVPTADDDAPEANRLTAKAKAMPPPAT